MQWWSDGRQALVRACSCGVTPGRQAHAAGSSGMRVAGRHKLSVMKSACVCAAPVPKDQVSLALHWALNQRTGVPHRANILGLGFCAELSPALGFAPAHLGKENGGEGERVEERGNRGGRGWWGR